MGQSSKVDYLVVGAGAMGMAFADTLLSETDATIAIVDRYHQPGGHWNKAYPFVRLHQPSAFYGVESQPFGYDSLDLSGDNEGLYELASSGEVLGYLARVMQQTLLPSGRVTYYPSCEHEGDGRCHSIVTGERFVIEAGKTVDATYMQVTVPAMRPPPYVVDEGVDCIAPNALPTITRPYAHYTVVGAGKTGMDTCAWLSRAGVPQDRIRWIMPRDSWLLDRARFQLGDRGGGEVGRQLTARAEAVRDARDIDHLFDLLAEAGELIAFSEKVRPSMYRCATVSRAELQRLRGISDIVRLGRVARLTRDAIALEQGSVAAQPDTLYIDCTADGLERRPAVPVFNGNRITLQSVRICQQVFSAALIAHVEAALDNDDTRNALTRPVPHPDQSIDWLQTMIGTIQNQRSWALEPRMRDWLANSRLDWFARLAPSPPDDPAERAAAGKAQLEMADAQARKLQALLAASGRANSS